VKTVTAFLKAGVEPSKLNHFQEILEENAFSLSGSQHLRKLIPFVLKDERTKVKKIEGKTLSVIFDGTTHVCEATVVLICFVVDIDWTIKRVVRLMLIPVIDR